MNRPLSASYDPVAPDHLSSLEESSRGWIRRRGAVLSLAFGIGAAILAVAFYFDEILQGLVRDHATEKTLSVARWIGRWGDFAGVAGIAVFLWVIARLSRMRCVQYWIHLMMLAAVLSGVSANVVRVLCGRARPNSGLVDGWHGPRAALDFTHAPHRFHAFPSAHTAVVAGFLCPVLCAVARRRRLKLRGAALALGAFAGMLLMATARVCSGAHHVSDVLAALFLGGLWGWALSETRPLARFREFGMSACRILGRIHRSP